PPPATPGLTRGSGGEHTAYAARPYPHSSQLQGGETRKRGHDRNDPEPDHDLRLGPALLLEVVMQRCHAEHALAGEAERDHLHDHRYGLEHEQSADDRKRDLLLGGDRDGAEQPAERERTGVAHEDRS